MLIKQSLHSGRLGPTYNYYIIFNRTQINLITLWYVHNLYYFLNILRLEKKKNFLTDSFRPGSIDSSNWWANGILLGKKVV